MSVEAAFEVCEASTDALREQAYRLRYQVYCLERAFEDPNDNPDGLETDEFDSHAMQSVLIHRESGMVLGAVRLVFPVLSHPDASFAIQRLCQQSLSEYSRYPLESLGEVSRFCLSKEFRWQHMRTRRLETELSPREFTARERREINAMTMGLIEGLVRMSVDRGVVAWCAIMEPTLLRMLGRLGIHFENVGPLVDFHGKRQPCYQRLDKLLERVRLERPEVWNVLTNQGEHWAALMELKRRMGAPMHSD